MIMTTLKLAALAVGTTLLLPALAVADPSRGTGLDERTVQSIYDFNRQPAARTIIAPATRTGAITPRAAATAPQARTPSRAR
jgi:hypothetical protein